MHAFVIYLLVDFQPRLDWTRPIFPELMISINRVNNDQAGQIQKRKSMHFMLALCCVFIIIDSVDWRAESSL